MEHFQRQYPLLGLSPCSTSHHVQDKVKEPAGGGGEQRDAELRAVQARPCCGVEERTRAAEE